jgi:hypothetical protein
MIRQQLHCPEKGAADSPQAQGDRIMLTSTRLGCSGQLWLRGKQVVQAIDKGVDGARADGSALG